MLATIIIFCGAGIGGVLRHGVNLACARQFGMGFPWATLSVNVIGSFVIGLAAAWFAFRSGDSVSPHGRLFFITGVLGGFTTFSAFSLDVALMWERGSTMEAGAYVLASVILSIVAIFAGLALVRAVS